MLGPLRAFLGDTEIPLGPAKQQAVLAVLLTNADTPVPRDEIIAGVWGAHPPESAAGLVATYVVGLRRALGPGVPIAWTRGGYLLCVPPDRLDRAAFDEDVAAVGDLDERAAAVARALGRWRGVALAGVPGPHAEHVRAQLAERRLAAIEQGIDIDLSRGRSAEVLPELFRLIREHPRREPLHGMLMRALHAAGRTAEALTVFHQLRRVLVDGLGVEPAVTLRDLHQRILLDQPVERLPAVPPGFVGRTEEITRLTELLMLRGVAVVSGASGSGKTALALQVAAGFPGAVFVDAAADGPAPAATLLVLDDVRDASLVRAAGCVVLATSRAELDLPGVRLGGLDDESALVVLASCAGRDRIDAEPEQAARIVELCAGMPRALRAASERLAARPEWTLKAFANRLTAHDLEVRRDFHIDYTELPADEARVFRLLGSLPGAYVDPGSAAVVLGVSSSLVARTLDLLASRRLVEPCGTGYRFLPVPQLVAREHAEQREHPSELDDLQVRALGYYRAVAREADVMLRPGRSVSLSRGPGYPLPSFRSARDAVVWWEEERENLVALALRSARRTDADPAALATLLTDLRGFLHRCGHWTDWADLGAAALRAGLRGADPRAQAVAELELGTVASVRCRYDPATGHLGRAARAFHALGDLVGEGRALNNLAVVHTNLGRHREAALALRRCLDVQRAEGDRDSECITLDNLAMLHLRRGSFARAIGVGKRSIRLRADTGTEQLSSAALAVVGKAHSLAGTPALPLLERALELTRAEGNRYREAYILADLGDAWLLAGRPTRAVPLLETALSLHHELCDDYGLAETTRSLQTARRAP